MKPHSTATTKLGTIHGVSISVRTSRWPRIGRLSSNAISIPPTNVPATVKNVYCTVFMTAPKNPSCNGLAESNRIRV